MLIKIIKIEEASTKKIALINEKCLKSVIYKENLILAKDFELNILNFKGVCKQNLKFPESEGKMVNLNTLGIFLVMWTTNNYIRLFDISRRELKQIGVTRRFEDSSG